MIITKLTILGARLDPEYTSWENYGDNDFSLINLFKLIGLIIIGYIAYLLVLCIGYLFSLILEKIGFVLYSINSLYVWLSYPYHKKHLNTIINVYKIGKIKKDLFMLEATHRELKKFKEKESFFFRKIQFDASNNSFLINHKIKLLKEIYSLNISVNNTFYSFDWDQLDTIYKKYYNIKYSCYQAYSVIENNRDLELCKLMLDNFIRKHKDLYYQFKALPFNNKYCKTLNEIENIKIEISAFNFNF